jgi:hypothetical protein
MKFLPFILVAVIFYIVGVKYPSLLAKIPGLNKL